MELRYEQYPTLPDEPRLTVLVELLAVIFPNESLDATREKLCFQNANSPVVTQLAFLNDQLVGCKLGYRRKPTHFYSWVVCIPPSASMVLRPDSWSSSIAGAVSRATKAFELRHTTPGGQCLS